MEKQKNIIQADATNFKGIVQKLTGAPGGSDQKLRSNSTFSRRSPKMIHERRKHFLRDLGIIKLGAGSSGNSTGKTQSNALFSPVKGPVTPLSCDSVSCEREGTEEEERAIAEKGFYLHASPQKAEPPILLTLFPLVSPTNEF